jgi:hypothetical protein
LDEHHFIINGDIVMNKTEESNVRQVDQNELRVNATLVVTVLVTAFIVNRWELVAFQAGALFLTALHLSLGPYVALYRHILRPAGIVKPDLRVDNPEPHRNISFSNRPECCGLGNGMAAYYPCGSGPGRVVCGLFHLLYDESPRAAQSIQACPDSRHLSWSATA